MVNSGEKVVRIACEGAAELNLDDLTPIQDDLKELSVENYQKLRGDILNLGFSEPISIWAHDNANLILNGHQRYFALKHMRDMEGYSVPPIPVSWVEADNLEEAQLKILSLTSNFGEVTPEGLYKFMNKAKIPLERVKASFRLPEINMPLFEEEFFDVAQPTEEPDHYEKCDKCGGKIKSSGIGSKL